MREKDELADVFRSWSKSDDFDFVKAFDDRQRRLYGIRYDSRTNLIDWDYHMCLLELESAKDGTVHPPVISFKVLKSNPSEMQLTHIFYSLLVNLVEPPNTLSQMHLSFS